jgi:radical SAM superfamily enzyme YgiQ (UPF0313 family)
MSQNDSCAAALPRAAPAPSRPLRIALLSPRGPLYRHRGGIWKKSLRYAPLTLTTLAALVPAELQADVRLLDEGIEDIDLDVQADLVGISAITGSAPRAYELADHFRRRGIPVVLGGVHPTLMPQEAAQHADAVVIGYAEQTWPQLLRDFVAGRMQPCYQQGDDFTLANLPLPRRDMLAADQHVIAHTIEATRGCVHRCDFCVVPAAWQRPVQRPVAEVIADIRQMQARRLIFLDLNLIANRAYARELFQALIPLKLQWGGLATTTIAHDDELLDLAARSGCRGLLLGFESLAPQSLQETHKGFNARQDYREVARRLHERGIAIQACFAFGFDHDTAETFAATVEYAIEACIDLPRYAILTPFPNTALYRRLKQQQRILTEDWSLYDGQHVVFQPQQMSPAALLRGTEWAWKQTYRWSAIARRIIGARIQVPLAVTANLGYRFYAYNLSRFYTCREALL